MPGGIRKSDILAHPIAAIRSFGWRGFFRTMFARDVQESLANVTSPTPPPSRVSELIERCIKMEWQAGRIYERLAAKFDGQRSISGFFETLAQQEHGHAQLLEVCRALANRTIWNESCLTPSRKSMPRLEQRLHEIESGLDSVEDTTDALRLVIEIEGSEFNHLFKSVVAANYSMFVRKVLIFQTATESHIAYMCEEIPKLEPALADECRKLKERFFISSD